MWHYIEISLRNTCRFGVLSSESALKQQKEAVRLLSITLYQRKIKRKRNFFENNVKKYEKRTCILDNNGI